MTAYLTATAGCRWTVTNNYPTAITITMGASGIGNGTIYLTIAAYPASNARTFYLPLGTTQIQINQSGTLQLMAVAPCRIMDTRNPSGPLGGPYIAAGATRTIPVAAGACGIPANAAAYSLNITVAPRTALGYLTVWPTGQPQPLISTLNSLDGLVLANAAIVPAGASGSINAYAMNDTELIVDINGYFAPPATGTLQFYPLTPCRILDTRNPNGVFGGPSLEAAPAVPSPSFPAGAVCPSVPRPIP